MSLVGMRRVAPLVATVLIAAMWNAALRPRGVQAQEGESGSSPRMIVAPIVTPDPAAAYGSESLHDLSDYLEDTTPEAPPANEGEGEDVTPPLPEEVETELASLPGGSGSVSPQATALPSGAATQLGMGESFTTQLSTGTAGYSVPISIPAARGGVQPRVDLTYSSAGGYGLAGTGWSIGGAAIARQSDRGLPSYDDRATWHAEQDKFSFGGMELVPICTVAGTTCMGALASEAMPPWANGWQYFRPRIENGFLRFFWSPDHRTWRVQSTDGANMEFGVALDGSADDQALEYNPDDPSQVSRWYLARQYDAQGVVNAATAPVPINAILYRYIEDGGALYLSDIFDTSPASDPTSSNTALYAHHTRIRYEARPDIVVSYRSGWPLESRLRVSGVDVTSKPYAGSASAPREVVRRYHLSYDPYTHSSLLTAVQLEGRCQSPIAESSQQVLPTTACPRLPPLRFEYGHVDSQAEALLDSSGYEYEPFVETVRSLESSPAHALDEELTELADVNADGLPDVLVTAAGLFGGRHGVYFGGLDRSGAHGFGSLCTVPVQPAGDVHDADVLSLDNNNVAALDVDSDGILNLIHMPLARSYSVFAPVQRSDGPCDFEWQGREVTTASRQDVKIDFTSGADNTRVMDVNGDGLVDIVHSSPTEMQTFFSLGRYPEGDDQFGSAVMTSATTADISNDPVTHCAPWSALPVRFSDPDVHVADLNGDGLPDLTRVRSGQILYWPGRGNGMWGTGDAYDCPAETFAVDRHIVMDNAPVFGTVQPGTLLMNDVNGDGLSDLVEVRNRGVDIYLNDNGLGWTARHIIEDTPFRPSSSNYVRLTDINGSGTPDIVWGAAREYRFIDLYGGERPHLLTKVHNGLGSTLELEYESSTEHMLAATAAGNRWKTRGAVVMPVLARTVSRDNLQRIGRPGGIYTTEYTYRDPVFEGRQREFRGFREATVRNPGDSSSPTSFTRTTFQLGECPTSYDGTTADVCSVPERWQDNWREALKGLPVLNETFDEQGTYLATDHTAYRLRQLYTGMDGRRVVVAQPSLKDVYAYDTAAFDAQATMPAQLAEVELDLVGITAITETRPVVQRASTGTAHLRSRTYYDDFGNTTVAQREGCVSGCPAGVDEVIYAHSEFTRPAGDQSGWLWREQRSWVDGSVHTSRRSEVRHEYDARGQLLRTYGILSGTLALDRFHATGATIAPNPTDQSGGIGGSVEVLLVDNSYDQFGHTHFTRGPNNACTALELEPLYSHLPLRARAYAGVLDTGTNCGTRQFVQEVTFDRGLGAVVTSLDPTGQPGSFTYDGFGRLVSTRSPDPANPGQLAANPNMVVEYTLPADSEVTPYTVTRVRALDGANHSVASYSESWTYTDGFGRSFAALTPADPTAQDLGDWVAGGDNTYNAKGQVEREYDPWFYNGAPEAYPLALQPRPSLDLPAQTCWPGASPPGGTTQCPFSFAAYDAFGRQIEAYARDGLLAGRTRHHALSVDSEDRGDALDPQRQGTFITSVSNGHGQGARQIIRTRVGATIEQRSVINEHLPTGEVERVTMQRAGSPDVVRWLRYDTFGRVVLNVEPNSTVAFSPDLNTPASAIKAWRYAYNDSSDLVGVSDSRGCGTNYSYDTGGRILAVDRSPCAAHHAAYTSPNLSTGDGTETFYRYDVLDTTNGSIVDAAGNAFAIDSAFLWGRVASVAGPASKGVFRYDALGRATGGALRIAVPGAMSSTLSTRYAPRWYLSTQTLDVAGRPLSMTTGATSPQLLGTGGQSRLDFSYTKRGVVRQIGGSYGVLYAGSKILADGKADSSTLGDAAATTQYFDYDALRRLSSRITVRSNGVPLWTNPAGTTYTPPSGMDDPTRQLLLEYHQLDYDLAGNLYSVEDLRDAAEWPAVAKPVSRTFEYDDLNRLTKSTFAYDGGSTWQSPFNAELTDANRPRPGPYVSLTSRPAEQTFSYDWLGNITQSTDDAHAFVDRSTGDRTHGTASTGPHRLLSASNRTLAPSSTRKGDLSVQYDAAGSITDLIVRRDGPCLPAGSSCWQRFHYQWNEVGELSRARRWDLVTTPTNERTLYGAIGSALPSRAADADLNYAYDADGNRVLKSVAASGGAAKHTLYILPTLEVRSADFTAGDYVIDPLRTSLMLPAGPATARVVYSSATLPNVSGEQQHIFLQLGDHLGSASVTIDKATGELVEYSTHQTYGAIESDYRPGRWASFREPYKFTGKEEDIEVGLQYFGARYYSPYLGIWMSTDPVTIHELGSDTNPYSYVSGSPMMSVDPDGRLAFVAVVLISAAIAGAISVGVQSANVGFSRVEWGMKGVAGAMVIGAVSGAVGGAVGGLVSSSICGTAGQVLGGIAGGISGAGAGYTTGVAVGAHEFSGSGLASSLLSGAAGGFMGGALGNNLGSALVAAGTGGVVGTTTSAAFNNREVGWKDLLLSVGGSLASAAAAYGLQDGPCFVAGTKVLTNEGSVPIEDVDLGQRVAADEKACADIDVTGWKRFDFVEPRSADFRVSVLRPEAFGVGLMIGATTLVNLPELDVHDHLQLVNVSDGVVDQGGGGCPVITVYSRTAGDVIKLTLSDDEPPLEVTHGHRFYSQDRCDWVPANDLVPGEHLTTASGKDVYVTSIDGTRTQQRVFNLEVAAANTYYVGDSEVLCHNERCGEENASEALAAAQWGNNCAAAGVARHISAEIGYPVFRNAIEVVLYTEGLLSLVKVGVFGVREGWRLLANASAQAKAIGVWKSVRSAFVTGVRTLRAWATTVRTPWGIARQARSAEAMAARSQAESGARLYRIGTTGKSQTGQGAQFWSLEAPSATTAARNGIPAGNVANANFIETAVLKPGARFVTRQAPGVGANGGGAIEVVVEEGGVVTQSFSHFGF